MQIFTHLKSKRVVYFTYIESTFLQSFENVLILQEYTPLPIGPLPIGMFRENTYLWTYSNGNFSKALTEEMSAEILLNRKCAALHRVQYGVAKARYPFVKHLHSQDDVYDRKFWNSRDYVEASEAVRVEMLPNLHYLRDEAEIMKVDHLTAALEVMKRRSEREWILRASERARRILTEKICEAATLDDLTAILPLINDINFRVPMVI